MPRIRAEQRNSSARTKESAPRRAIPLLEGMASEYLAFPLPIRNKEMVETDDRLTCKTSEDEFRGDQVGVEEQSGRGYYVQRD